MNDGERLARAIIWLLRLYPAPFRAEFAEEIESVLAATLADAASRGRVALLAALMRESTGLIYGAAHERRQAFRVGKGSSVRAYLSDEWNVTRLVARAIAGLTGLWWLLILLWNDDARAEQGIFVAFVVALALVGALIEPWRRRLAGALMFAGGLLLITMMLLAQILKSLPLNPVMTVVVGMPLLVAGSLTLDGPAMSGRKPGGRVLIRTVAAVALALSWWGVLVVVNFLTEIWLVPWDTWAEPVRPPVGAWQRAVNDFFESGIGARLPALMLIGSGALALLARLRAGYRTDFAPWLITTANLLVILVGLAVLVVTGQSRPSTPEEIGYRYTWPGILTLILSCAGLIALIKPRAVERMAPTKDPAP
jgi:MFS family permease